MHFLRCAGLTCRPRTQSDLADCVTLLEAVYRADEYPATWPDDPAAWVNPPTTRAAWVALRDSRLLGHIAIGSVDPVMQAFYSIATGRPAAELAEMKRLFVLPAARGTGVARLLQTTWIQFARVHQLHPVLETMAENERAIRFYERSGWCRVGSAIANWRTAEGERPLMALFAFTHPI